MNHSAGINKVCQSEDRPQRVCSQNLSHAYKSLLLTRSEGTAGWDNSIIQCCWLKQEGVVGTGKNLSALHCLGWAQGSAFSQRTDSRDICLDEHSCSQLANKLIQPEYLQNRKKKMLTTFVW